MIINILNFIGELIKWIFRNMTKIHIQSYLILILFIGFIKPFYLPFTKDIDTNLKGLIVATQEKNQIKREEIISECTSKKVIVLNDFKKAISNKDNLKATSNKNSLNLYTKKECEEFYTTFDSNKEIKSEYWKKYYVYTMILYIINGLLIFRRWY